MTKLMHEAPNNWFSYYITYMLCVSFLLHSSSFYSEVYITALSTCSFKCHLTCPYGRLFISLIPCVPVSLNLLQQTVCLSKCGEQLEALQRNQIVRLSLASRCSLSDGCEVQQMVAKLCFSTKREDDSFILNLSRWPGQPPSIYAITHTNEFIKGIVQHFWKYDYLLSCWGFD